MRGVSTGVRRATAPTARSSIYLDDQPLTSISQQVDIRPIDIERIEVDARPAGHAVRIELADRHDACTSRTSPTRQSFGAQVDGEVSYDQGRRGELQHVSGHVNIPVTDNFAVRAVGFYSTRRRVRR